MINNQNKKPIQILIFVVLIIIAGVGGYFIGTEFNKYKTAFNSFYSEILDEIFSITGTIKAIDNTITLEISSLENFLPGEEIKTEERIINLNAETKIVEQTSLEISEQGVLDTQEVPLELTKLKVGDIIAVETNENIKTKKEFTATKIILIKP